MNASESFEFSSHCRAMFKAAVLLSQQYNIKIDGQFIEWQVAQTNEKAINAISSTCQAASASNIVGIVGPVLSRETPIIAEFGERVGIPVISYAATDPDLSDRNAYPAFYRTVPSDNATATAIVKLFLRFNWTSCIIIYQNDAYGSGGEKALTKEFMNNGLTVVDTLVFDIATLRIRNNMKNVLTSSSTRIVVVWAGSRYTSIILQNAFDSDVLGPHFTWILSSSVSLNSSNETFHQKTIGMLTVEPISGNFVHASINTTLLNAAYNIWKQYEPETFPKSGKVDDFALFAFDATWLLIQSLQEFCLKTTNNSSSCISFVNSSFCFDRHFLNSESLFDTINNMTFLGVSGPIQFNRNVTDRIDGSFYYAQNSRNFSNRLSFVPVLKYSNRDGWQEYSKANVIIWSGSSLVPPTGGAKLDGVKLRIGVVHAVPFTMINTVIDEFGQNTTKLIGYIPDLIDLLQKKMKFIPNIELIPLNRTYASLGQLVEDRMYDIIVGDVTITATRRGKIGFSNSIFDDSLRLIIRKSPDVDIVSFTFMKPFSLRLWLLILCTVILTSILICLIERKNNRILKKKRMIGLCAMSVWYTFGNLVGYGAGRLHPKTPAGRLLTAGLYILCLVLVASYTANLASDLTISKSKNIISGIDDIKSGKISSNRIGIRVGTAMEEYYLREISNGNRNYHPLKSQQDIYDSLLNNIIDVSIHDAGAAEYVINNIYCNLTLVGEGFDKSVFGIITPKQWLYGQDLDVNILSLRETGSLDNLRRKWFQIKKCSDSSSISTAIDIEALIELFILFGVFCILSLFLFVCNKLKDFCKISKQFQNDDVSLSEILCY
ncbi:unnamed protein product [Rotaria sp. Silwood1]|nr:unnamed protein product [Rotaria sp. Silwood1]CAF1430120.1 unnamed protein product [Rotaria sp. Silwood1]CAF3572504.1 unnamed protein product [Rotaria sp. Silwood1]